MKLPFYKYQGTGNDFIVIDNRKGLFDPKNKELVIRLCDRKFGIGADGLMLLQEKQGFDFEMIYFNSDGSQSLCGNGSRCITAFALKMGIIRGEALFLTTDGPHNARTDGGIISLDMMDVLHMEQSEGAWILNTGSPHYVKQVHGLPQFPVVAEGRAIRNSERFIKDGINVNFIEAVSENRQNVLYVRTYERGVENETLSCGTGVTACALVAHRLGLASSSGHCVVKTPGGELKVRFKKDEDGYREIRLEGPAEMVFEGVIEV
ncbi:MAG: diaminopimelate epimerase [Bacteroidia bacterium]|nr:diaminopimelate epimerase [Bacteroidia bacterium]